MSCSTIVAGATPYDESHAIPSRTRSTLTVYGPALVGALMRTVVMTLWPGATSPGRLVRSPSQITVCPVASNTWAATWIGFGPAALQVARPLLVNVTGSAMRPPGCSGDSAVTAYEAPKPFVTLIAKSRGATPWAENHATPPCTRSIRRKYAPRVSGDVTGTETAPFCPGPTAAGHDARAPSRRT